ncbi:hypothetical protein ACFVUN_36100 [Kitasatospora griseola]|uniref:hypothetical protein n=1 Tax=Kitasatospora griseola TaxID=2064 RepID=UPI0036D790A1
MTAPHSAPARREQPYLSLKIGGLTVVLRDKPRWLRATAATGGVAAIIGIIVQARYGM